MHAYACMYIDPIIHIIYIIPLIHLITQSKINSTKQMQELLNDIFSFYYSERLYLLKIIKHIYGHWQDPDDPCQVTGVLDCTVLINAHYPGDLTTEL